MNQTSWCDHRFRHEIVVAIREHDALVVLTACSHNGLLNMVETASAEFPGAPVRAVVGGFHLAQLPPCRGMSESERAVAAGTLMPKGFTNE
jgi:7,8-dihydropterin-6-yl-methyl-4-(beta-D-ribofuranosyl)aminobenzene 5'-phosphate synthase